MTSSDAETHNIRIHRTIGAPPDRVYRAWLDPNVVSRWLAPGNSHVTRVEVEERIGGAFRVWQSEGDRDIGGFDAEVLELIPPERIVFQWGFVGPDRLAGPKFDSLLTILLEPGEDDSTELTLIHERLDDLHSAMPDVADSVADGWDMVIQKLSIALRES